MAYKDPERGREYGREWMKRNPEKAREAMRRWNAAHPEEHNARNRAWREANPDKQRALEARYRERHPEALRAKDARRRARKREAGGTYTVAEWQALTAKYGGACGYCGVAGPLHADHRTPLARGGSNGIGNIIPACARCNWRKGARTEAEFRAWLTEHPDRGRGISEDEFPYTWSLTPAG